MEAPHAQGAHPHRLLHVVLGALARHEWTDGLAAVLDGGLDMAAMISHRAPLSEAPAVFAEIGDHRLTHRKIVFDPAT